MLDPSDAETLEWLVLKHLAVNVVAFRHDLSDPEILLSFAAEVGSIRRLELLVVHTYADLVAVGPGVASDWKVQLIESLYKRTRHYFDSGNLPGSPDDPEIDSEDDPGCGANWKGKRQVLPATNCSRKCRSRC